ncbi:MAG: hemerythrin domain-containing protein [Chloroflexi bacterium]|nr:MAG: hemerythrin domain-containing protein [Chloroflexota bacterium]
MKITDALLGEHGAFYAQFDHLQDVVPATGGLALVQALGALLASSLEVHAKLENDLLITALERRLGTDEALLQVMRQEHEEIEGALSRLRLIRDLSEAQDLVLETVDAARNHFLKEEQALFPMAEEELDAETLVHLGEQWAEMRGVKVA